MKYIALTFVAICISVITVTAQFATEMVEYNPAPGQLVNTDEAGSFEAAVSVVGSADGLVSLGSYGGSIILRFDKPVLNDQDNPYGIDFVIFGNPQPDWAEPGIVMVMKDENKNGKADDTWYELAGSEYHFSTTYHQFSVTYYNPNSSENANVSWVSSDSQTGFIFKNGFHEQDFYPSQVFFESDISKSVSFSGTRLNNLIDFSDPAFIRSFKRKFGYADNNLRKNSNYSLPDNPYTSEIEGCGGDAMDIGWAVDENGNYVDLDQIDFVKIYTGVLDNAGWLGEISTEICGIADIPANASVIGSNKCIAINYIPSKLFAGDSCKLEVVAFKNGRYLAGKNIIWNVDNKQVAAINENGFLNLKKTGTLNITASLTDDNLITASLNIEVIAPSSIEIVVVAGNIRIDEETEIKAFVKDDSQNIITGAEIEWNLLDKDVLTMYEKNGKHYIKGLNVGNCLLVAQLKNRPELKSSLKITVLPESLQKEVFITVNDDNSTLIPHEKIVVKNFNLNPFVDQARGDYGIDKISGVTVAHSIAQAFVNSGFTDDFRFRDDERGGNNLYLWKIPKGDPSNIEYIYGYGGYTESVAFSKSWVVLLNNKRVLSGFDQLPLKNGDEIIVYHVSDITSSKPLNRAIEIRIWPQPASDFVNIFVSNQPISSLKIMDLWGKIQLAIQGIGTNSYSLKINGINSGMYILQVCTDQGLSNHKIIIQ